MSYPLDKRIVNGDPNNPWNLAAAYQVFENEDSSSSNLFILQKPDENTNMFTNFGTSFFATCLLLTAMKDNDDSYLIMKAEYLAKIELFYLLPHQRRWKSWFPEVMYYHASVDKTRKMIKEMIENDKWHINEFPELKQNLLNKFNINKPNK
ncbi:uncharacterized protein OCT59_007570 [Rhizophagus irregularis]|uniref:uncharacterized protein n=1 Tax=Rhizophagus irregularis TaxID=588596 RepID=UPI00332D4AD6|nr:hypothetical protein OCT59_007570 [Rhizophagus irregularis]